MTKASHRWRTRHDGSFGPPEHWYKITIHYCPVCGKSKEYRERRYGKRPKDIGYQPNPERFEFVEMYDYCMEWDGLWA